MTRRTVLIAGAGFSQPANGPVLANLLDAEWVSRCRLTTSEIAMVDSISRQLRARQSTPAPMSVEDLFSEIYRRAKTRGRWDVDDKVMDAQYVLEVLQRYLASTAKNVRLRRGSMLWERYRDFLTEASRTAHRPTIITFNYDLLIEHTLDDAGLIFDFGGVPDIRISDRRRLRGLKNNHPSVRLLKLHGSIGWGLCHGCATAKDGNAVATVFEKPYIPRSRTRCPHCETRMLEPGLVPPINAKAGEIPPKEALWELARYEIRRATEILVMGYSLPSTDYEARSLLSEAKSNSSAQSIIAICGHSGASPSIKEVFPKLVDSRARIEEVLDGSKRVGLRWWGAG